MDIFTKRKITRCRTFIPVNDICEIKREIVSEKKKSRNQSSMHSTYYTMEFHSLIKKNEIVKPASKRIELGDSVPSKVTQTQINQGHMFPLSCGS